MPKSARNARIYLAYNPNGAPMWNTRADNAERSRDLLVVATDLEWDTLERDGYRIYETWALPRLQMLPPGPVMSDPAFAAKEREGQAKELPT